MQHLNLRLFRDHVGLRNRDRGLLRLQCLNVNGPLLRRQPSLADERAIAIPGYFCKLAVGLSLLKRRLELPQRSVSLRNLMIQFGSHDFRQQLPSLHSISDIDLALVDIAAGAREDVCDGKRRRRGRQGDDFGATARPHRGQPHLRNKVAALQGGVGYFALL